MHPINVAMVKAVLEDRYRKADHQRLVAMAKARQIPEQNRAQPSAHAVVGTARRRREPLSTARLTLVLFIGAAFGATAYIASATVAPLAALAITDDALFAGMPLAAGFLGIALASLLLPGVFVRWGLRRGLILGYLFAFVGSVLLIFALSALSFPLLLVGMALIGVGHACNQLTRYAAADLAPVHKRATALGTIVWAGTLGSIVGPLSLQPSSTIATSLGRSELTGGFLVSAAFLGAVISLYLFALRSSRPWQLTTRDAATLSPSSALRRPSIGVALTAMIGAQTVMYMIMTATPLHIRHHGLSLAAVGVMMTAHAVGMFAFAPLVGRFTDRRGATSTMVAGMTILGMSALAASLSPSAPPEVLALVLFALGVGWSLAFVSGSSILAAASGHRQQVRGLGDSLIWLSGGAASIASGVIYRATDFAVVALVGLSMVTATSLAIAWRWKPTAAAWADAT